MRATRADAYQLFHSGAIALADVEASGIRIDTAYLDRAIFDTGSKISLLEEKMRADPICKVWRKRFGSGMNLGSRAQLGAILFRELGLPHPRGKLPKGNRQIPCDESVLESINTKFTRRILECEKLKKLKATYLEGVRREVHREFIHPSYNLHMARTYRSSSDSPNFQNIPIRDPEHGKTIRSAFIPREGHILVEVDFKGAEVSVGACYHKDPRMIEYLSDPSKDMHRDVSMQIFKLKKNEVQKPLRNLVKGSFVFAEFYGSWYKNCAPSMWNDCGEEMRERLRNIGITELGECDPKSYETRSGTFENHVQKIERDLWNKRFPKYRDWKKQFYEDYLQRGHFDMLTGFHCPGVWEKNQVVNYPIQGAAFHCLLWVLIELNRWLRQEKMKSVIVGQIHDSMLLDIWKSELEKILKKVQRLITMDLPRAWPWIIVPLTVEIEGSDENWFLKKALEA